MLRRGARFSRGRLATTQGSATCVSVPRVAASLAATALSRGCARIFGFQKVRYRGLAKNLHRLEVTAALANLYLVRRRLLRA